MKPISQLLRQPIRTIAVLLLLTVSASFMCLGWGVMRSTKATTDAIDNSFITLALFNPSNHIEYITEYEEETGYYIVVGEKFENSDASPTEVSDAIMSSPAFKERYYQKISSAYNPALRTVTSATSDNRYSGSKDYPYTSAVLIFKLTDFSEMDVEGITMSVLGELEGEVVEYLAIHPDYEPRGRIKVCDFFNSQEDLEESWFGNIQIGHTYIVSTTQYSDSELHLKTDIIRNDGSRVGATIRDIDWNNIMDYDEFDPEGLFPPRPEDEKMYWDEEFGFGRNITGSQLDSIDRCEVNINGSLGEIAELDGSLEDFLADPANSHWVDLIDEAERKYNTVDVIGTDLLDSIQLFHEKIAFVSDGRSFETADYENGSKVCLISESVAYASGLSVGDKIDLDFYDDTIEYEIIGLYRHTDQWPDSFDSTSFDISPNTIYVPAASLDGVFSFTQERGAYYSLVLKNGHIDEVKAMVAENGWAEDFLLYYDSGYSEIADTIVNFGESAKELFIASVATFLAVLIAYIALFVIRQRRNAGLMLSLGSGKRRTAGFILATSMIPAAVSSVIGAVIGAVLLNRVVNSVFNEASDVLDTAFSSTATGGHAEFQAQVTVMPSSTIAACIILIFVYLAVLAIISLVMSSKKPLSLIKK